MPAKADDVSQGLPSCLAAADYERKGDNAAAASDDVRETDFYKQAIEAVKECEDKWPRGVYISANIWMIEARVHIDLMNLFLASGNHDAAGVQFIGAMGSIVVPCDSATGSLRNDARFRLQTLKSIQPRFPELSFYSFPPC
jgi:hypothetical protein